MEGVGANGECSDTFVVFELQQTNGAVFGAVVGFCFRSVEGKRQGFDGRVVEAVRGKREFEGIIRRERVEVARGGWEIPTAATSTSEEAEETEDFRDDALGDET